jgi:hypothetical protein
MKMWIGFVCSRSKSVAGSRSFRFHIMPKISLSFSVRCSVFVHTGHQISARLSQMWTSC